MSTTAHTPTAAMGESALPAGLRVALGAVSKDLTMHLLAVLHAQLATKSSRQTVEKAMVESVPLLLEQAFVASFLSGKEQEKEQARERRAVLAHVLSAAELRATVGKDWTALLHATSDHTAAAHALEDEELTSEAASKFLHVSRTHINSLADSGALGIVRRTDGGHRRISKAALLQYKATSQGRQARGLDAMMAASQKLGLYDAELKELLSPADR